jgi:hypothetical protein
MHAGCLDRPRIAERKLQKHHPEGLMNTQLMWVIVGVAVALAIAVVMTAFVIIRNRRSDRLRRQFGPEYERTVREKGDVRTAEAMLQARSTRVERLHIRTLTADDAKRFSDEWRRVQAQFVDDPANSVTQADRLVGEVMSARGYPVGDFEQRVEDISVDHPNVVMNYRAARDIAEQHARHAASTEDLRQAMVHYRALFAELLEETPVRVARDARPIAAGRGRE